MKKLISIFLFLCLTAGIVSGAFAEAQPAEAPAELFGSPWINTNVIGNLPETAPEAKDDFYACVNYNELAANQAGTYMPIQIGAAEIQPAVMALLQDESVNVPGLDQLKIFWEQVADMEALHNSGNSEVIPYLDRFSAARWLTDPEEDGRRIRTPGRSVIRIPL